MQKGKIFTMKSKRVKIISLLLLLGFSGALYIGCNLRSSSYEEIDYVIGVSQANMREPWRLVLMNELNEEISKHSNIRLITTDATSNSEKQKKDVKKLLDYGIDLLIVSPSDVKEMTPVISEVYDQIPVIVMDKAVEGFDYTLFIGPDNKLIGRQAGEDIIKHLGKDKGAILELCGSQLSQASKDKSSGFESIISKYPNVHIKRVRVESELRDEAEDMVLSLGEQLKDIDIIFAHNDYMALGAYNAINKLGYDIKIVGIDGFNGENDGINLVKQGKIDATIACSTGGKEAIQYAVDILNKVSGVPKQVILRCHSVNQKNVTAYVENQNKPRNEYKEIIDVGYSQLGSESAWRLANTRSIKEAAKDLGINLIYEDADQSQEKQIAAIRKFIDMKVDVIVISPVVDNGWNEILQEAKDAGIPVLLSDRKVEVEDDSLYSTYIGADFIEEGRRAMRWIKENVPAEEEAVNILEIQGTLEASPTVERKQGFEEILNNNSGYEIVYSKGGDYTYAGGKEVIEEYMKTHEWDIDAIFAHNDDMALGAIKALEAYEIEPGKDVKIVSVDGTRKAFEAMIEGKLNCVVECSPLLGPQLMKAIQDLMDGKELPLRIITDEKIYTQDEAKDVLSSRKY